MPYDSGSDMQLSPTGNVVIPDETVHAAAYALEYKLNDVIIKNEIIKNFFILES
tara:strand:+ start:39 stop:200 length:162 start_codon:yes stop_codon:yes gene_type:complete